MLTFYNPVAETDLENLCQEFEALTGYFLLYEGKNIVGNDKMQAQRKEEERKGDIYPENPIEPVEQNLAFSCIEAEFEGKQVLPCKKGIQTDSQGKFLQLAFLSPQLGAKMKDTLQRVTNQTGWRIRIADSVNQNIVITYAGQICRAHNVALRKNPSYLPGKQELLLRPTDGVEISEEVRAVIEKEILEKTGLGSGWE